MEKVKDFFQVEIGLDDRYRLNISKHHKNAENSIVYKCCMLLYSE